MKTFVKTLSRCKRTNANYPIVTGCSKTLNCQCHSCICGILMIIHVDVVTYLALQKSILLLKCLLHAEHCLKSRLWVNHCKWILFLDIQYCATFHGKIESILLTIMEVFIFLISYLGWSEQRCSNFHLLKQDGVLAMPKEYF